MKNHQTAREESLHTKTRASLSLVFLCPAYAKEEVEGEREIGKEREENPSVNEIHRDSHKREREDIDLRTDG